MTHKTLWLKVSNLLLYVVLCLLVATGILLTWQMQYGFFKGTGTHWLGISRQGWKDFHLFLVFPLVILTVLHMVLNIQWLKKVAAHDHSWRWILGIGIGLLMILLPFLIPATQS